MIVVSGFEAPAVIAGFNDVAVVGQPVEQRGGHLGIAEDARRFAKDEIGGQNDGGVLIKPAHEVEEKLAPDWAKERYPSSSRTMKSIWGRLTRSTTL